VATSGSFNFSMTRNDLITQAFRTMGVLADIQEAAAEQVSNANTVLNVMIKSWRNKGISLPLYQELTVYLEADKQSYLLGATGDRATATGYKTELSVAGVATNGTITVDTDDDITNGDVIGIVLDDETIHWTTVNGVPAANVVTLTAALPSAAAIDNHVYNYTSIAQRPITIKGARLRDSSGNETPVNILTREEYFNQSNKTSSGRIVACYYDPQINNGVLYVWQPSNNVSDTLHLTVQRQVADFDTSTDNADFPEEWLECIIWNLAARLMTRYGVDAQTKAEIGATADKMLEEAEDFDREDSIRFVPDCYAY